MEKKILLSIEAIGQTFKTAGGDIAALKKVNLDIFSHEFLCLIGPSGCGKSTLLRIIAGLEKPTSGQIVRQTAIKQAMIFQNFALFPWLTVGENIGFGLKMSGLTPEIIKTKVHYYAELMGLTEFLDKHPKELSGGMKQRVGIARSLAIEPDILLMDEPFSALDAFTAKKLRADLLRIWEEKKLTVVMVTHLVEEAVQLADRIAVFSPRPGTITNIIENNLERPRNVRSETFYQRTDRLEHLIHF